jgi:TatD DNase family protein
MHCFAEDWEIAKQALDIGFYISFSGIVTFKNAKTVHEVAQKTPLNRILVETDAPYLAPTPFRGKMNEPAYVKHTAEHVAELRGISLEEVAAATTENFFTLFSGVVKG